MILKNGPRVEPVWKTITLDNGETFDVQVTSPTFNQRANDEGREMSALIGNQPDCWANFRIGRIRDVITDWRDVTNEKMQEIPFTAIRLLALCDTAPEVADQLKAICNEVFAPLGKRTAEPSGGPQKISGEMEDSIPTVAVIEPTSPTP